MTDTPSNAPIYPPLGSGYRSRPLLTAARIIFWGALFATWMIGTGIVPAYGLLASLVLGPLTALLTWLERRRGLRPVAARTFLIVATSMAALGFGAAAVREYQSNECRPGLPYPCSDSHSEIIWSLLCIAAVLLLIFEIWVWLTAADPGDKEKVLHP